MPETLLIFYLRKTLIPGNNNYNYHDKNNIFKEINGSIIIVATFILIKKFH
jgi:hypothetical protein